MASLVSAMDALCLTKQRRSEKKDRQIDQSNAVDRTSEKFSSFARERIGNENVHNFIFMNDRHTDGATKKRNVSQIIVERKRG